MSVQPTDRQLRVAEFMRERARGGRQSYLASDYVDRCTLRIGLWVLVFCRMFNLGKGYWVQLTLTRKTHAHEAMPITPQAEEKWLLAFFGNDRPMVRTDGATSDFGRRMGTRHYRLFTDQNYKNPYIPQIEVSVEPQGSEGSAEEGD